MATQSTVALLLTAAALTTIVVVVRDGRWLDDLRLVTIAVLTIVVSALVVDRARRDRPVALSPPVGFVETVSVTVPLRAWLQLYWQQGLTHPTHLLLHPAGAPFGGEPIGSVPVSWRTARRHRRGAAWAAYGELAPGGYVILASPDQVLWGRRLGPVPTDARLL